MYARRTLKTWIDKNNNLKIGIVHAKFQINLGILFKFNQSVSFEN